MGPARFQRGLFEGVGYAGLQAEAKESGFPVTLSTPTMGVQKAEWKLFHLLLSWQAATRA